jgi:hypothetical protein
MDYYETPISIESIELVAFSLVGLLVAFPALTRVIGGLNDILLKLPYHDLSFDIHSILPNAIQSGLGIWLFLRPWQFQGWIEKFKPKGTSTKESAS